MPKPYDQLCPIARTLDIIGERWTLLILRDIFLGKTRFGQILASSPGLPSKLLSERLKKLENEGLLERAVYSEHPLRAEYRLTERGQSLGPVMEALVRWGFEHCFDGQSDVREAIARRLEGQVLFAVSDALP